MERLGNYFTFTKDEQNDFSVDEVVTVDSALDTSFTFIGIASGLQIRAENLVGDTTREAQNRRSELMQRSSVLNNFGLAIQAACAPSEVDTFIKNTLGR